MWGKWASGSWTNIQGHTKNISETKTIGRETVAIKWFWRILSNFDLICLDKNWRIGMILPHLRLANQSSKSLWTTCERVLDWKKVGFFEKYSLGQHWLDKKVFIIELSWQQVPQHQFEICWTLNSSFYFADHCIFSSSPFSHFSRHSLNPKP